MHVKNVNGLNFSEVVRRNHQCGFCCGGVFTFTNQLDDLIDDIERLQSTVEQVQTSFSLIKTEFGTTSQYFDLVADVSVQSISQRELTRNAVDQGNHVDTETCLQLCLLEQVVEHNIGVGITLELNREIRLAAR